MSVFLSYSRQDSDFANRLFDDLCSRGMQVWMDRDSIQAGTLWRVSIAEAIQQCSVFLIIVSKASQESKNVAKEISLAESHGKCILPLMIDDTPVNASLGYCLAGIEYIDLHLFGYNDGFDKIVNAIGLLAKSACTVTPALGLEGNGCDGAPTELHMQEPSADLHVSAIADAEISKRARLLDKIQHILEEELGPVMQLLWSSRFANDILSQPEQITARFIEMGVPEATSLRVRERLRPLIVDNHHIRSPHH